MMAANSMENTNNPQVQKQLMLKDTASRVNAWGFRLRQGVELMRIDVGRSGGQRGGTRRPISGTLP